MFLPNLTLQTCSRPFAFDDFMIEQPEQDLGGPVKGNHDTAVSSDTLDLSVVPPSMDIGYHSMATFSTLDSSYEEPFGPGGVFTQFLEDHPGSQSY